MTDPVVAHASETSDPVKSSDTAQKIVGLLLRVAERMQNLVRQEGIGELTFRAIQPMPSLSCVELTFTATEGDSETFRLLGAGVFLGQSMLKLERFPESARKKTYIANNCCEILVAIVSWFVTPPAEDDSEEK